MTVVDEAAARALQETKAHLITSLTEAVKKFPTTLAAKIGALFSQSQGEAYDKTDMNDPGYLANLQTKYEEAIKAIDDAVYGSNDEDKIWNLVESSLKVAFDATPADQADWKMQVYR